MFAPPAKALKAKPASPATATPTHGPRRSEHRRGGPDDQTARNAGLPSLSVRDALQSPGFPLDARTRAYFEPRFGRDFSGVRVHVGERAAGSASGLGANAFTVGQHIVFGQSRFDPVRPAGLRLIAHELAHTVQQRGSGVEAPGKAELRESEADEAAARVLEGGGIPALTSLGLALACEETGSGETTATEAEADPWDKLSPPVRAEAEELHDDCMAWIKLLSVAQQAHTSALRGSWLRTLSKMAARISAADTDRELHGVKNAFTDFTEAVGRNVTKFAAEWVAVEERYRDERRWLMSASLQTADTLEAARFIDEIYRNTKAALQKGAQFYITDEEYAELKKTLETGRHLWVGALRGARIRAKQLRDMMDAVADLRRNGQDAEKYVPGWNDRISDEAAHLDALATRASEAMQAETDPLAKENRRQHQVAFAELRSELLDRQRQTLAVKVATKSGLEKGAALIKGGVEAFAGIFVEAAKQTVDLAQIGLHFVSFGKYEPKFISDLAAAAEQGATTGDLLKGMVVGLLETPSRFLKACEDGDWEAIGREAVNLYILAKTIRQSPETIKKIPEAMKRLPELLERTNRSLRILRARTVAFALRSESRVVPQVQSPPVTGFRPQGGAPARPAAAPPQAQQQLQTPSLSPPVRGFRPPGDTPAPAAPQPPAPSPPVQGFRPPGYRPPPAPVAPEPTYLNPSRPVAGFGRKAEPPPASQPPSPLATTQMPPPGKMPSSSGTTGMTGRQRAQPVTASSEKPPSGGRKEPGSEPAKVGKVEPAKGGKEEPAKTAEKPAKPAEEPGKTRPESAEPLITPEKLNQFVPQEPGVRGPKRRLNRSERANANTILRILERIRKGEQGALRELEPFRVKQLTGDRAGWWEIDLLPDNPGALNQMRIIFRIHKGGIEARLLQMH